MNSANSMVDAPPAETPTVDVPPAATPDDVEENPVGGVAIIANSEEEELPLSQLPLQLSPGIPADKSVEENEVNSPKPILGQAKLDRLAREVTQAASSASNSWSDMFESAMTNPAETPASIGAASSGGHMGSI